MMEEAPQAPQAWLEWFAGDAYRTAWKAVVRPSRCEYSMSELGPSTFSVDDLQYERKDLRLKSCRGHHLECLA